VPRARGHRAVGWALSCYRFRTSGFTACAASSQAIGEAEAAKTIQQIQDLQRQLRRSDLDNKFQAALSRWQTALAAAQGSGKKPKDSVVQTPPAGAVAQATPLAQVDPGTLSREAIELDKKAAELYRAGKYQEAIPIAEKVVQLREKLYGSDHPATADSLNKLAMLYKNMGDYAKAEPLYQRALAIREKALGPDHPTTADSLNNLAMLYKSMGDYAKAEPLYQRALAIREKALGPDHPATAGSLNNLALLYDAMGDYAKAEPLYQRALAIREKALGPDHPATAASLDNLAVLYGHMGNYAKSEPLYQRALAIREKALGPDHLATADSLANLAVLYGDMGNYAKAEPLCQRVLRIHEKTLGPDHPDTANSLNNLAMLYQIMGDYAKAEPLYQRALAIREKALGLDHPDTALSLDSLAGLYWQMGNYAKAEPLYQRALAIREKALGPDHPKTASTLNNLAGLYYAMGDYVKAEPLLQRALAIQEKVLGPDHPNTALSLNNLAELYKAMGDYAKAEPLYQRSLAIYEKVLGPDNPDTADILNNLAELYKAMGDYAKAEPLLQRALAICEKALGPDNPKTALGLNNLSYVNIGLNRPDEALKMALQAAQAEEKLLGNILSFTSEEQRSTFQKTTNPYTLFANLGQAPALAQTLLRNKAIVLDSLLEDRLVAGASRDPAQRAAVAQLVSAKQRLMQFSLEKPKDFSAQAVQRRATQQAELSKQVEDLEVALARQVAGLGHTRRALGVTVPQVQAAVAAEQALIELLRYKHYLGKNKFEMRYGAVVIGHEGEPRWVVLGKADEIEKNLKRYQKTVRNSDMEDPVLSELLRTLDQYLWEPIRHAHRHPQSRWRVELPLLRHAADAGQPFSRREILDPLCRQRPGSPAGVSDGSENGDEHLCESRFRSLEWTAIDRQQSDSSGKRGTRDALP